MKKDESNMLHFVLVPCIFWKINAAAKEPLNTKLFHFQVNL